MRVSLLVSLGLSPLSCGGTAINGSDGSGSSPPQAAAGAQGGSYGSEGGGVGYAGSPYGAEGGIYWQAAGAGGNLVAYGGGGAGGSGDPTCDSPTFDPITHLTRCASGLVHRPTAVACAYVEGEGGAADMGTGAGGLGNASLGCQTNADCAVLPYGYCDLEPPAPARCRSGCHSDSDCATGQLCECQDDGSPGRCMTASCRVDADCGPNSLCAPSKQPCSYHEFTCTSVQDECLTDAYCQSEGTGSYCSNLGGYRRTCSSAVCSGQGGSSGRPFLVDATPRLAGVEARSDWSSAEVRPNIAGLSPLQRAALSAHWARLGQMEHASIAAFARFNLQLLSLGAPGQLIEACNRALVDETAHTRLCFALASEYGGAALGPARLDIEHCFEDNSLEAIMKLVLREGCLGETVAALEAIEPAAIATDPAVKSVLSRIARDEQAHAELAFKFLAWALPQASPEARAQLEREAQRALDEFEAAALARPADQRDSLASDGIIGTEALRAIHLDAVREVVEPLLSAILPQSASANHSALTRA